MIIGCPKRKVATDRIRGPQNSENELRNTRRMDSAVNGLPNLTAKFMGQHDILALSITIKKKVRKKSRIQRINRCISTLNSL